MTIHLLAFDADDTLWLNETLYHQTQEKWKRLLASYVDTSQADDYLFQTEMRNIPYFGFGIKSFTLSMIQAAAELTQGCIQVNDILEIVEFARQMLDTPVELLDGVQPTIERLAEDYPLMMITKGDLLDQQRKLSRSGLESYFKWVEVVSDKTPEVYAHLLSAYQVEARNFMMVGNSLRSDVLPVVMLGAQAVYVPFEMTWAHEHQIDHFEIQEGYYTIDGIAQLPELIASLNQDLV